MVPRMMIGGVPINLRGHYNYNDSLCTVHDVHVQGGGGLAYATVQCVTSPCMMIARLLSWLSSDGESHLLGA
jgi:hypothetical protein